MTEKEKVKTSKFLSFVLRHEPKAAYVKMNSEGWVNVTALLQGMAAAGYPISRSELEDIVATDNKQRYSFDKFKTSIRANQGHSVSVDLSLEQKEPPLYLYHGTGIKYIDSIFKEGIKAQSRQYVHLSKDVTTAKEVGKRHGDPWVLTVEAHRMYLDGYKFYLSENGVWLTDKVPVGYFLIHYEKK